MDEKVDEGRAGLSGLRVRLARVLGGGVGSMEGVSGRGDCDFLASSMTKDGGDGCDMEGGYLGYL